MARFVWPALPGGSTPEWTGAGFVVDGRSVPFLAYSANEAGWDDELTALHAQESGGGHPIDITSRSLACDALRRFAGRPIQSVIEIGSSEGLLLRDLRRRFPTTRIVGCEVAPDALRSIHREQPDLELLQMDLLNCPLPSGIFDAVVALNVLEHIEDDSRAIREMARLLAPGGLCVIEVPASPGLYDAYDAELKHFRRYTMRDLAGKVAGAGLEIVWRTHIGFFVYPAFWAIKKLRRTQPAVDKKVVAQSIRSTKTPLVDIPFRAERAASGRISWPFGIRCFVAARKRA